MEVKFATVNCQEQSKFSTQKQLFLQDFVNSNSLNVVFLQESNISKNTFKSCNFKRNNFSLIVNNAVNEYGTAMMIKNTMDVSNVNFDSVGRLTPLDCNNITLCNTYLMSGTDGISC